MRHGEVWSEERCYITELLNDPAHPEVSLARCRVEPGVTTQLHRLAVVEWYVVSDGQGRMELGQDPPFLIAPGDVVRIPAGTPQRVTNVGESSPRKSKMSCCNWKESTMLW